MVAEKLPEANESAFKSVQKKRRSTWNPEGDAPKEIIVPFDESSFSGLLVDNKTFQDAYTVKSPSPPLDNLRLDAGRTIGTIVNTPGYLDDLAGFFGGILFLVEVLLIVWTAGLLLYHFPISKWLAWSLISSWSMTLITFQVFMGKPVSYRGLLWGVASAVTLLWLAGSP